MKNAKKYYKHWAESGLGKGNVLMEARGDRIVRQVEIYGSKLVWADENGQSDDRFHAGRPARLVPGFRFRR